MSEKVKQQKNKDNILTRFFKSKHASAILVGLTIFLGFVTILTLVLCVLFSQQIVLGVMLGIYFILFIVLMATAYLYGKTKKQ